MSRVVDRMGEVQLDACRRAGWMKPGFGDFSSSGVELKPESEQSSVLDLEGKKQRRAGHDVGVRKGTRRQKGLGKEVRRSDNNVG